MDGLIIIVLSVLLFVVLQAFGAFLIFMDVKGYTPKFRKEFSKMSLISFAIWTFFSFSFSVAIGIFEINKRFDSPNEGVVIMSTYERKEEAKSDLVSALTDYKAAAEADGLSNDEMMNELSDCLFEADFSEWSVMEDFPS